MNTTTNAQVKLTDQQTKVLGDQLCEKYGYLAVPKHEDRFHISGYRVSGSGPEVSLIPDEDGIIYLVVCLDPLSPFGQLLGRYCIPFVPSPEFHFDKAHLWIYPAGEGFIRIEVRFPAQRRFVDQNNQVLEMVYGVQVKAADANYLKPVK